MLVSSVSASPPSVSIVLPTYNRAHFLPQAFESIRSQQWTDWELIVVDDGSTDNTYDVFTTLAHSLRQPVRYFRQDNQGAHSARNTGLAYASGTFVAFFDSDDVWLPHHLKDGVCALADNGDLDWVFSPCRCIDATTGNVVRAHTFYTNEKPDAVLKLSCQRRGSLTVLNDEKTAATAIRHGLRSGPQTSIYRRRVFDELRFPPFPPIEDQLFTVLALKAGFTLGYLTDIHVNYYIHDGNVSCSGRGVSNEKRLRIANVLVRGYEWLAKQVTFDPGEFAAYRKRLGSEYFWHLGYACHWLNDEPEMAFTSFKEGLRLCPWDWRMRKTYCACWAKSRIGGKWSKLTGAPT